jgi:hypothetical protein
LIGVVAHDNAEKVAFLIIYKTKFSGDDVASFGRRINQREASIEDDEGRL